MCLTVSTKTSKTNCTNSIRAENRGYRQHGTSATYQTALTTYIMFVHVRVPETFKRTAKKSQSEGEREAGWGRRGRRRESRNYIYLTPNIRVRKLAD